MWRVLDANRGPGGWLRDALHDAVLLAACPAAFAAVVEGLTRLGAPGDLDDVQVGPLRVPQKGEAAHTLDLHGRHRHGCA